MKNSPLLGILAGLTAVLLLIIFSLGYKLNTNTKLYFAETKKRILAEEKYSRLDKLYKSLEKRMSDLELALKNKDSLFSDKEQIIANLEDKIQELNVLNHNLQEDLDQCLGRRGK